MGIIGALGDSYKSTMADQWLECIENIGGFEMTELVKAGKRLQGENSVNTKGNRDLISNGSIIIVGESECALALENGKIIDTYAEPGEHRFHSEKTAGIFSGGGLKSIASSTWDRFGFAGVCPITHKIYYINLKEIPGLSFHSSGCIPCRFVDDNIGLDIDLAVSLSGMFSIRVCDPVKFYTNVARVMTGVSDIESIQSQMKSEVLTVLQTVTQTVADGGVRASSMGAQVPRLCDLLTQELTRQWSETRGIAIVSMAISSMTISEADSSLVRTLQRNAVYAPMPARPQRTGQNRVSMWMCSCGKANSGKFCSECGSAKP